MYQINIMRIFITGGGGFIGSHLVKFLLTKKFDITIFDNLSNSTENKIKSLGNVNFIQGDIRDYELLKNSMKNHDLVIHLAAKTSVFESEENSKEVIEINVKGSQNVLTSCIDCKISKFFAMSSAAVYGEGKKDESKDEESPKNPISTYGKSKLEMENAIINLSNTSDFNSVIFRLFNVYGEGQSDTYAGVIRKFVKNAKEAKPVIIYGNGEQTRDFIHIDDVIQFIDRAIQIINRCKGEIFNIGTEKTISIKQLAETVFSVFKMKLEINYAESINGDIKFSSTKIDKVIKELKYIPKIQLKEGISTTFC